MKKLEVKGLIFVTADSCRAQLERLTQILVSYFPGSTIYQHTALFRVPHDVLNHRVDAVLLGAEMEKTDSLELLQKLRRQIPDLPVFILSQTNAFREKAVAAGANGYFVLPESEQHLLEAIRLARKKENVS